MAKKRTRRRRNGFSQAKIFGAIRKAALLAPAAGIWMGGGEGNYDKMARTLEGYTGFNIVTQKFNLQSMKNTYYPYLGATVATVGLPKVAGLIRGMI